MQGSASLQAPAGLNSLIQEKTPMNSYLRWWVTSASVCFLCVLAASLCAAQQSAPALELTRTVRSWEFLPVVGTQAGLFGNETGNLEAWVYPLKIFRDFHLVFHVGDRAIPAASLARSARSAFHRRHARRNCLVDPKPARSATLSISRLVWLSSSRARATRRLFL